MNSLELIRTHPKLECIGVTPEGWMERIPGPDPDDIARFYVARYEGGEVVYLVRRSVFAVAADGQIVSTCESSRENAVSAEAWVRTLPEYRRRGYARQTTAAWAHDLQQSGKLPFYSHRLDNLASQAIASSLSLVQYIADVGYG